MVEHWKKNMNVLKMNNPQETSYWETWETIYEVDLKIGDNLELPTLFGRSMFTVTKIENDCATLETEHLMSRAEKIGYNKWKCNHCILDKNGTARVTIVN